MSIGPGKYDELATFARLNSKASGVIVIVMGGIQGSGFACQFEHPIFLKKVPQMLREIADQIEKDSENEI